MVSLHAILLQLDATVCVHLLGDKVLLVLLALARTSTLDNLVLDFLHEFQELLERDSTA